MLKFRGKPLTIRRIDAVFQERVLSRFERMNSFHGAFETFAEAARAAPRRKPVGYDLARSDDWYLPKLRRVSLEDYPVLFWLRGALEESRSVYEIGGHVGVAFYGYQTVLAFPEGLEWTICDVPSVAEAGRKLARERGSTNVRFVSSPNECDGADVVLAIGALQYVEVPSLAETIASFSRQPTHVIVSNTPVCDGPSFVTLQNIGTAHCPYRIFNRTEFVGSVTSMGFELIDTWEKPRKVRIPRHPDKTSDEYAGFYFRRLS